jgi:hypothetical protein
MKKRLACILFFVTLSVKVFAQGPPPPPPDPSDVPIDGGLGFLIAGGMAYGAYQLKKRKQDKEDSL